MYCLVMAYNWIGYIDLPPATKSRNMLGLLIPQLLMSDPIISGRIKFRFLDKSRSQKAISGKWIQFNT